MKISVSVNGLMLEPHWYDPNDRKVKMDRFRKRGGYRVHPSGSGHNDSEKAVFYRSLEDIAAHLVANPDWGLRFTTADGSASIFYNKIAIDGVPR
jgi:hypothetical protein